MGVHRMRLKFNGMTEKRKKGCNCSGSHSETVFTTSKSFILPSGRTKTFRVGKIEEVSKEDGDFLLSYDAFEVV